MVVAADRKRSRVGQDAVNLLLKSLAGEGVTEVGATITDGNVASSASFSGWASPDGDPGADWSGATEPARPSMSSSSPAIVPILGPKSKTPGPCWRIREFVDVVRHHLEATMGIEPMYTDLQSVA
jgi:hypothetical protein